jgi:hypothetical protein
LTLLGFSDFLYLGLADTPIGLLWFVAPGVRSAPPPTRHEPMAPPGLHE